MHLNIKGTFSVFIAREFSIPECQLTDPRRAPFSPDMSGSNFQYTLRNEADGGFEVACYCELTQVHQALGLHCPQLASHRPPQL